MNAESGYRAEFDSYVPGRRSPSSWRRIRESSSKIESARCARSEAWKSLLTRPELAEFFQNLGMFPDRLFGPINLSG